MRETIKLVIAYVNLILGDKHDNEKETPMNYDMQFNPMEILSMDRRMAMEILSMDRRMEIDTQVVCKTIQPVSVLGTFDQIIKEALSSFKEFSFKFVKQSANQVFYVREVVSMSDCKECLTIPSIFIVNVSAYD